MKSILGEFKEFINKGNVILTAVGLVMALYFKTIIDSVIAGVIDPIIAWILGEDSMASWGFHLGDGADAPFVSIGLVINAIITFVVVAAVLFLVVKAYNRYQAKEEAADEALAGPTEVELLTEIRDALRTR